MFSKVNFILILILIIGLISIRDIFKTGYFPMHDDTQVQRVFAMGNALKDLQFPVRVVRFLGYNLGYPIFNFYAPLPYYIGGLFYIFTNDSLLATKIIIAIGQLLSGIVFYYSFSKYFNKIEIFFGTILYLLFPYHAVQWFVRGAFAEAFTLVFLPLIIRGILDLTYEKNVKIKNLILIIIGFSGVILSHTILGLLTLIFFVLYYLIVIITNYILNKKINTKSVIIFIIALLFSLILTAFFWIPATSEMNFTNVSNQTLGAASYNLHFVCPLQFWNSPWGYGGSTPGCIDGMSFKLGKLHIISALFGVFSLFYLYKKLTNFHKTLIISLLLLLIFILFFMTALSSFIWNQFSILRYVQYPWRMLTYSGLFISIISMFAFKFTGKFEKILVVVYSVLVIFTSLNIFRAQYTYKIKREEFENFSDISYRVSKISDEYLGKEIEKPTKSAEIMTKALNSNDLLKVEDINIKSNIEQYIVTVGETTGIKLYKYAFSGWIVKIDGIKIDYQIQNDQIYINIPKGSHKIDIILNDTNLRLISNIISITAVILFITSLKYANKTIS